MPVFDAMTAPHQRLVVVEEEADRHQLQVVLDGRDHQPVDQHRLLAQPEHVGNRVAVDVGVEHADTPSECREGGGEVDGERRLADAPLAGRDGDDSRRRLELDGLVVGGTATAELRRQRRPLLGRHHVEVEPNRRDAVEHADLLRHLLLERRAQGAPCDRQCQTDDDVAAVDRDVADHVEVRHGAPQLRVDHLSERGDDCVTRGHRPGA
jgi:hypothetical protein